MVDMPFIAPELIIQAKQMDLLTYLRNYEPYELVKFSGNTYCTRTHESLKISNGKWIWWSRGIGGRSAFDYLIKVPQTNASLFPILANIPLQLLAYYIADALGREVDQPRNLAKSVTVE